jgi:hypothetical protein
VVELRNKVVTQTKVLVVMEVAAMVVLEERAHLELLD